MWVGGSFKFSTFSVEDSKNVSCRGETVHLDEVRMFVTVN
jgi:hypothetical protein